MREPSAAWSTRDWLAWGVAPLVAGGFGLLAVIAGSDSQTPLFLALNARASALPPALWSMLTMLGDTTVLLALLSPLLLVRPRALLAALASAPAGGLMSVALKQLADAPRPGAVLDPASFHLIGPLLVSHSFPSGHSITAFAVFGAVLASTRTQHPSAGRSVALVAGLGLAALIGVSRIAVGAHWPADVIAGAMAGWLAGLSGAALVRHFSPREPGARLRWALAVGLATAGVWLMFRREDYALGAPIVSVAGVTAVATLVSWAIRCWPRSAG